MSDPTQSYRTVWYDLRPAKQVERRMMIDVFGRLAASGFHIADYQYTGLGSIYFVDFILLHRYLGMNRLLSIEHDYSIPKRTKFNVPFSCVEVRMGEIGQVIAELDRDLHHLLWLDYDQRIDEGILADVALAAYKLSPGSVVIITVDVEPPDRCEAPRALMDWYQSQAGDYFEHDWDVTTFARSCLPAVNFAILRNALSRGLAPRAAVDYLSLFKFVYADGHEMITLGGMIGTQSEAAMLAGSGLHAYDFVRLDAQQAAYHIKVPRLSRKERLHLDQHMPCSAGWTPSEFELSSEEVQSYSEIYRFCPTYAELLL